MTAEEMQKSIDKMREALKELYAMLQRPMKSWDAGDVVCARRVEEICEEALS